MKPSILFLVHLPPPAIGPSLINEKIVTSFRGSGEFVLDELRINTSSDLKSIEKFSLAKVKCIFVIAKDLKEKLKTNNYSLAYFTLSPLGQGFLKDLVLVRLLKKFKVKVVYHLHGKGIAKVKNPILKMFYRYCFKEAKIIVLSESLYKDINAYVKRNDVEVVPNGVDSQERLTLVRNFNKEELTILFLSNMVRSKGVFLLLEVAKRLKNLKYKFKLQFVGGWFDVTEREFVHKVRELGIGDRIDYLGFRSGKEKADILRNADIFVFPTYKDTFPLVLLEAMQAGLPIISTDEGAISDIIVNGKTGFLVKPKDINAFTSRLEELIKDKFLRERMSSAVRREFLEKYTFDKFIQRLTGVFNKLCAE